jgi:hypothetical protein
MPLSSLIAERRPLERILSAPELAWSCPSCRPRRFTA